jgi:hypothetical protein
MDFVLQGFGVFLGVLAGTAVTLLTQWILQKRSEAQTLKNLQFETELNIKKIDSWLEEITRYRNAVNGDALATYYGYFDLSRFIYPTANAMFLSGLLYKYLDHDGIGKLQVITAEFSSFGENYLNNQITQNKANFIKTKAVQEVDFWEKRFKDHRKSLEEILGKLRQNK